jgi:hypothetical protein
MSELQNFLIGRPERDATLPRKTPALLTTVTAGTMGDGQGRSLSGS